MNMMVKKKKAPNGQMARIIIFNCFSLIDVVVVGTSRAAQMSHLDI